MSSALELHFQRRSRSCILDLADNDFRCIFPALFHPLQPLPCHLTTFDTKSAQKYRNQHSVSLALHQISSAKSNDRELKLHRHSQTKWRT